MFSNIFMSLLILWRLLNEFMKPYSKKKNAAWEKFEESYRTRLSIGEYARVVAGEGILEHARTDLREHLILTCKRNNTINYLLVS